MVERVLIGNDGGSNYRFKVSKPGNNVLSAGVGAFMFDSDVPLARLLASGTTSFSDTGNASTQTTNNIGFTNHGYTPYGMCWIASDVAGDSDMWSDVPFAVLIATLSNSQFSITRKAPFGRKAFNVCYMVLGLQGGT